MDDGSIVWSPAPTGPEVETLLVRQLTPNGLADLTAIIFDSGLLSEDATYELERRPEAPEPPGRGVVVYQFTSGIGDDLATITSVQWLGDEEEETYYQPSPERRALDELARALRDPESLVDAGAWRGPAEPYVAADYQLVLMPQPDNAQYGNPDVADLPLDYDGPIEEFGVDATSPGGPVTRCGVVTQEEAAGIVAVFEAGDFGEVGIGPGARPAASTGPRATEPSTWSCSRGCRTATRRASTRARRRGSAADWLVRVRGVEGIGVVGDLHAGGGERRDGVGRNHPLAAVAVRRDGHAVEDSLGLGAEHGGHAAELLAIGTDDERVRLDVVPGDRVVRARAGRARPPAARPVRRCCPARSPGGRRSRSGSIPPFMPGSSMAPGCRSKSFMPLTIA